MCLCGGLQVGSGVNIDVWACLFYVFMFICVVACVVMCCQCVVCV